MKTYDTQEEFLKDCNLINNTFKIKDDIELNFDLDFKELNIKCFNLKAWNINANDIKATIINANNIEAENITADDISYYAVCFAYNNLTCNSIKGRQNNSKHFCLDGNLTINGVVQNA